MESARVALHAARSAQSPAGSLEGLVDDADASSVDDPCSMARGSAT